jgi:hypothetical protein
VVTQKGLPISLVGFVDVAEGRPHRLQQIALEAVNRMLAAARLRINLEDVQVADALIEYTRADMPT